jgi:serine/threonine protein kinase
MSDEDTRGIPPVPNVAVGAAIGAGSFGRVYRGHHRMLGIDVAVKVIDVKGIADVDSLLKEARLMARLDHPNLLRVFDAGLVNDDLYLVLELMDSTCSDLRRLAPKRVLDLTLQLLAGLQALHDARILHRDIKPANCLIRLRDGRVKLADLGIASEHSTRSTRENDLEGTLPYMAPELFEYPPRFSVGSDLYALGVTLHCMLLDRDPFPRGSSGEIIAWIRDGSLPRVADSRPDVPRNLAGLIDSMCARSAAGRPASATGAIASLSSSLTETVEHRPSGERVMIGGWAIGTEIPGDANFHQHAVTHFRTGVAGRIALLKAMSPLSEMSPLILASAERASDISHPGIATVVDWGLHDDRAYVVTGSQGQTLKTLVDSSGPIGELEALELTRDLADALAHLHALGLVYQVVNPLFSLLKADGRAIQLAWPMFCVPAGSSAISEGSPLLISVPLFAAPECLFRPSRSDSESPSDSTIAENDLPSIPNYQVIRSLRQHQKAAAEAAARIAPGSDLYGLGEILFYLIAGRPAYSATPHLPALALAKLRAAADLRKAVPTVTAPTARLVAELTSPDSSARSSSATVVRDKLDRILSSLRA